MSISIAAIKTRTEIAVRDRWNVAALFPSMEVWERELNRFYQTEVPHWPEIVAFRGKLHESSQCLKELLDRSFALARELDRFYTYAHLRHDEDLTDDTHKSAFQRISALAYDFQQETAWIEPEILALRPETIDAYLASPLLAPYRFHLQKIVRMRPHTLNASQEELLAMAGKPLRTSSKAFSALNHADIKWGEIKDSMGQVHPLSPGLYSLYLRNSDRTLRENAFHTLYGKYEDLSNTFAELLYGEIQAHLFSTRARFYGSCLTAALFPNAIPLSVYQALIQAVRAGLPLLHRYIALRKRVMKLPELHFYDLAVPLVSQVEIKMDYATAEELVIESVLPLGEAYQNSLRRGLKEEGWVDRFENTHKRSGAYSSGCYDSFPYILMNYTGMVRDALILAHEAGHSMHSYLSHQNQPYHYSKYPIFVAEVASTFSEELLMDLLMKRSHSKEERLFLMNEKLEDIRTTLFRQTLFAEFEWKIHELVEANTPLTPKLLKEIYLALNRDYFGEAIVIDPEIAIEWARIPHFYYNFYVYQYATGISAALSLVERVLKGESQAREAYLAFLSSGGSQFPIELLSMAGIEMTSPAPVAAALRRFEALLLELETALAL